LDAEHVPQPARQCFEMGDDGKAEVKANADIKKMQNA